MYNVHWKLQNTNNVNQDLNRDTSLWTGKPNVSLLPKLIYRFNLIPNLQQDFFFFCRYKIIVKFIWKGKRKFSNKTKVRKINSPEFQDVIVAVIKTQWRILCGRDRHRSMEQNKDLRPTQTCPTDFWQSTKAIEWRK